MRRSERAHEPGETPGAMLRLRFLKFKEPARRVGKALLFFFNHAAYAHPQIPVSELPPFPMSTEDPRM